MAAPKRQMQLNFFDTTCAGNNTMLGSWRDPKDAARNHKDRMEYYMWLAKIAEKGKISSIFFADVYAGHEVYGGTMEAQYTGGSQVGALDPVVMIGSMAAVTNSVSFVVTGSSTYIKPYMLARTWSSLDHITNGRVAWNIVTSYSNSSARAMGLDSIAPHDERYKIAEEYMEVVYRLWNYCWEDGAQIFDINKGPFGTAYDFSKIHKLEFEGKYHKLAGIHQTHPSPQRIPMLFQAGASKAGIQFAGKHAEGLFCVGSTIERTKDYIRQVREVAVANGRSPDAVKFFLGITPIIGRTIEEANEKFEAMRKNLHVIGGLARFGGFTGVDLSSFPLDEPFEFKGDLTDVGIHSAIETLKANPDLDKFGKELPWTPRKIGEVMAVGSFNPIPVGTPEMVADVFQKWFEEAGVDGFNVSYVTNPQSYTDLVELLVPELQRRGIYWDDYAAPGGTMRENFYAKPGQCHLPDDHPSTQFRWNPPTSKTAGDPLEGFRWNSPRIEKPAPADPSDPLSGYRWKSPVPPPTSKKVEDPLNGFRWNSPKVEKPAPADPSDPLSGYRWKSLVSVKV
ncbi:luciferase-like protein [Coleophoma crateriformis]|uniref:Luciferase-like protein n=1 Tax=Coleophoma crateriformis TaxID=565419 RepID=A0A3D8SI57_9HELO|nr:luciferase-like protein [Coleophoma crateriformis]